MNELFPFGPHDFQLDGIALMDKKVVLVTTMATGAGGLSFFFHNVYACIVHVCAHCMVEI